MNPVGRAKFGARAKLKSTPRENTRRQYVALVKSLLALP
jgi:acyl-CoA-binding protein